MPYDGIDQFPDKPEKPTPIRGVFGEQIDIRKSLTFITHTPGIIVDIVERENTIAAHLSVRDAKRLLGRLLTAVLDAEPV